jgi:MarR family transcriptional repressor of emrRAB
MTEWHGATADTVPHALGRLRVALDDAFVRASRELDLTAQQAELLCAAMRPTAVGDLAQQLRCDRSNVSRLVDRASKRGLLQRRGAQDGRVTIVELTTDGDQLARRFITSLEAQLAPALAKWSGRRQLTAVKLMNDIADSLETPLVPDPDTAAQHP